MAVPSPGRELYAERAGAAPVAVHRHIGMPGILVGGVGRGAEFNVAAGNVVIHNGQDRVGQAQRSRPRSDRKAQVNGVVPLLVYFR